MAPKVHIGEVIRNAVAFNLKNSGEELLKADSLPESVERLFDLLHEREEGPTIERVHRFVQKYGGQMRGKHHETYLNDFCRTAPERLKTVIRQPFG
jgi:hypothetical protein